MIRSALRRSAPGKLRRIFLGLALTGALSALRTVSAQAPGAGGWSLPGLVTWVGGDADNYARYLQSENAIDSALGWSIRSFSRRDESHLSHVSRQHPWGARWRQDSSAAGARAVLLPLSATAWYNSAYPFGGNDGPVWSGRGVTGQVQGGIAFRTGPLTIIADPVLFWAENRAFTLLPNGSDSAHPYFDPYFPTSIDRPQRFGARPYARLEPGESTARLELGPIAAGISSANQWWGPASTFPYIIGNNAAGVPHAFIGTSHSLGIGIGRVAARLVYGLESQSAFSPVTGPDTFASADQPGRLRFMSGAIVTFEPAAIPTLELGVARYFHQAWRGRIGAAELRAPFEGILMSTVPVDTAISGVGTRDALKNQEASAFVRWVLPHSGLDIYGEYGREDFAVDLRDLLAEPDHARAAMFGLRKVLQFVPDRLSAVRAEIFDATAPTLLRHRAEGLIYPHVLLRQGHTQEGQVIGASAGVGSMSGAVAAWDMYTPHGSSTVYVQRTTQAPLASSPFMPGSGAIQTLSAGLEQIRFLDRLDFGGRASFVYTTRTRYGTGGPELQLTATLRTHALPIAF